MPAQPAPQRRENVFTRRIGPLPMWAWTVIIAAVVIGWAYWKSRKSQQSAQAAADTAGAGQVPQFVNQTYTTVQPPAAPAPPPGLTAAQSEAIQDVGEIQKAQGEQEQDIRQMQRHPPDKRHKRPHPTHGRSRGEPPLPQPPIVPTGRTHA